MATSISSLIAEPLEQGDIIINEILYNPLADNEDNLPDQTEYVELYNPTNRAISIEGIFLHDAPMKTMKLEQYILLQHNLNG